MSLSQQQQQMLTTHFSLLQQWNRVHNLTRVCTPKQAVMQHYIDSLLPLQQLSLPPNVLDVGSGAGFPGLMAAVLWPQISVRLLDSCRKKCSFLQIAVAHMQLQHVRPQHGKAPDCPLANCVLSRATFCAKRISIAAQCMRQSNDSLLALWVTPQQIEAVNKYLQNMGLQIGQVVTYSLPHNQQRAVAVVRHV